MLALILVASLRHAMRLRVVIIGVVALAVIAGIWTYLALTVQETSQIRLARISVD